MKKEIAKALEPVVLAMGYEMWGLSVTQQGNSIKLTLYIDSENGIKIEDCERVSHQVTHLLDTEKLCDPNYVLEVSSPGFDRVLMTSEHFNKYLNEIQLYYLVREYKQKSPPLRKAFCFYLK